MWSIIAGLLSQNDKNAQANVAAGKQRFQDNQARVQQNRVQADQLKNQTTSANYGKYDMNNLIGGVFGGGAKSPNGSTNVNWGNYGI